MSVVKFAYESFRLRPVRQRLVWQSEILIVFPQNISFFSSENVDLCFELSRDFKHYFGFAVEEFFELGIS